MKICLSCGSRFQNANWRCPQCGQSPPQERGIPLFAPSLKKTSDGFRAEYFAELATLEADHFWFRNRNRLLVWALGTHFPAARCFLEVGCGTGFVLSGIRQAFPRMQLAGSELSLEGLVFARPRLPGVPLYQMDAVHIPFAAEFDVVGAFDVLEHVEEDRAVLEQVFQAVKPGGGLLLTVPQHPSLWSEADVRACHKRRYTRQELVRKVESAGFQTQRVTSFVSLVLPFLWVSRRLKRQAGNSSANPEFQVSRVLNWFLEAVLRLEAHFIRRDTAFPAGGSLLLVAQKP